MSHRRSQIRDQVVALLDAIPAYTGKVFKTRLTPVSEDMLPCLCVYAMEEASGIETLARHMNRVVTVAVDIILASPSGLDDQGDAIALEVEKKLGANPQLAGLARDCELTGTRLSVDASGERKHGHVVLTYQVTYRSRSDDPALEN